MDWGGKFIAWPVAYLMMSAWLRDFAYRTGGGWAGFVGTGLATLAVAFLTLSWQALKATRSEPVDALRYE